MTFWEYQSVQVEPGRLVEELLCLGLSGWEAFHLDRPGPWVIIWLKRPLLDAVPAGYHGGGLTGRLRDGVFRGGAAG